jgi:predicted nucleic acid-binding protein
VILLLDSTVLIDHLRGRPAGERLEARARSGDLLATTGINVEEIVRGLRPREHAAAEALFEGLLMIPIGRDEGTKAGTWRREFAAQGTTLSQADCLIAAAALSAGAHLATGNPGATSRYRISWSSTGPWARTRRTDRRAG